MGSVVLYIFSAIVVLCAVVAYFGQMIYGGIWWGRIRGCEHGVGRVRQFWQATLATWVTSLVLPGLAPWICTCILASWTTNSGCARFSRDLQTSPDRRVFDWGMQCGQKYGSIDGCLNKVCYEPHKYTMAWSIIMSIGSILSISMRWIKPLLKH